LQAIRRLRHIRNVSAFFAEKDSELCPVLAGVVAEYVSQGLVAEALSGRVEEHLDQVLASARGVPLFLFLDPCGAGMNFDLLAEVLTGPRAATRPVTEVLLNFNADLSRRVAGTLRSDRRTEQRVMDEACGGSWWREIAENALANSPQLNGRPSFEPVAQAIVSEYSRRLSRAARMSPVVVPVYRQLGHQPIYHLLFLTRSDYGLWVFSDAAARARQAWLRHLGKVGDEREPAALISRTEMMEQRIIDEERAAFAIVTANLRQRLARHPTASFKLVTITRELLGRAYGVATDPLIARAVSELRKTGEVEIVAAGKKQRPRDLVIRRPRALV
jgi:three-Cys-motif partner protein